MTSSSSTVGLLAAAPSGLILSVDGRNYSNSSVISDSITGITWNMTNASYNATRKSIVLTNGRIIYNNGGAGPATFNATVATQVIIYYRLGNPSGSLSTLFTIGRGPTDVDLESVFYENSYWDYQTNYGLNFSATTSLTGTTGWYMRAVVKNGASGTIYLNGSQDGSSTGALNATLGNKLFCVGADIRDGNYLNGEIAWVGLWNVALTASQIRSIYYNWYYAGNIPADSYTITPATIPYPATGTVNVQYFSVLFQSGASYTLKNASGTALNVGSYNDKKSSFPSGMVWTFTVLATSSGNIYVYGDGTSRKIKIFNFAGTTLNTLTAPGQDFRMCLDEPNNKIYCGGVSSFAVLNMTTNAFTSYSSVWINGVALGSDGYVYATTNTGYIIQKINPTNGTQTNIFTTNGTDILSDTYGNFADCTFDSNGYLYCVSRGVGNIYKFNTSGTLLGLFATLNNTLYGNPYGLTCNTATNDLYVSASAASGAIYKVTSSGTVSVFDSVNVPYSYSVFYDKVSNNILATNYGNVVAYPLGAANTMSFSFPASNLGQGSNALRIYDASGTAFGSQILISVACFLEGTLIKCLSDDMTDEIYIPVERLTKSTYVKTRGSGYVQVHTLGYSDIDNPDEKTDIDNRLFKYTATSAVPDLIADLYITGNHSALVETFSKELCDKVVAHMGAIYETEKRLRLPACLDPRAEPFTVAGKYRIWHFALNNADIYTNYGVYANGLLVESSSIRYMNELSKMTLVE
jgi:hypothetical protein